MNQSWEEKRRFSRFRVNCPVSFLSSGRLIIGETVDLSLGGMKIQCRSMLSVGQAYDFTVLIDDHPIGPNGRIVYRENQPEFTYNAGVSFLNLPKNHHNQLSELLSIRNS